MPEISLFNSISDVKNPKNYDLIIFLENIRDGEWFNIVKECRAITDYNERKSFKQKMPTATFSGTFSYRNDNGIEEHSGIIAMDLDNVENIPEIRRLLQRDKYVFACFLSTSGTGLRVLFRVEPNKHDEAFRGLLQYLNKEYSIVCDLNSSKSKPYIVSFDPMIYMLPDLEDASVFKKYVKEHVVKKINDFVHTTDDFTRVLKQIVDRKISIADDYLDYIKIGFAIASVYGESGREYFHQVCQFSVKYKVKSVDDQYKYILRNTGGKKANIATFYYFAKINGISITSETTKVIIRTTRIGRKAGLSKDKIVENLKKFNNLDNTSEVVSQVFDNQEGYEEDQDESILYQLEMFISNNYDLEKNEITGYIENNRYVMTPGQLNAAFIAAKKTIPTVDYQLFMRLLKSDDFIKTYNPFYEFFGSDGIPYILPPIPEPEKVYHSPIIDLLSQTIINENPSYTLFFVRKWIVSIISSAHKVHSPLLLCLLGGQNTGKTEWFRRLLPIELQAYYAESKLDKEKDDELLMTEKLVIMDDELGGKSKQDNLKLKNITSKQYFSIRRPYGDHNETILRIAVLCGTSNNKQILSDSTGNRRIIPVEVSDINKELYNSIDKKQLFLEAFRLYKEGFDWRITQKDVDYLNKDQEKYEMVIKEKELIERYFIPDDKSHRLTSTDILVEIELLTHQKLNINEIGRQMEKLGYVRKTDRHGSGSKKWCVKRINRGSDKLDPPEQTELQKNTF